MFNLLNIKPISFDLWIYNSILHERNQLSYFSLNISYSYNEKNEIVEITDFGTRFNLEYNADGTLSELSQSDGIIAKKLVFVYE